MIKLVMLDQILQFSTIEACWGYLDMLKKSPGYDPLDVDIFDESDNPIVREWDISESISFLKKRAHENHKKKVIH
jgi:hypothetical protein